MLALSQVRFIKLCIWVPCQVTVLCVCHFKWLKFSVKKWSLHGHLKQITFFKMISFCRMNKCMEWNFCQHDKVMYRMCFLLSSESWNLFSNYRKYWRECTWHWLHELSGFAPYGSLCCWWGKISCILTCGIEKGLFHSHFVVVVALLLFVFVLHWR